MTLNWRHKAGLLLTLVFIALFLVGCSTQLNRPESKLVGKWQEEVTSKKTKPPRSPEYQYEFFSDGTVVMNQRIALKGSRFVQAGTGTYEYIDSSHLKVDLGLASEGLRAVVAGPTRVPWWGTHVYELSWPDDDHVQLQAAESVLVLERMQGK
jgi:hypothetical protein